MASQLPHEKPQAPLLVFDIETVPDIPLMMSTYKPVLDFEISEDTLWKDMRVVEAIRAQKLVAFPPPIFHSVVSICAVFVNPDSYYIADGFKHTIPTVNSHAEFKQKEAKLLRDFWDFTIKYREHQKVWYDTVQNDMRMSDYLRRKLKPAPVTFCGYNITGFDLPVIEQRSLSHLLVCPIAEYAREYGFDSYRSKYALDKCFDLCHYIANNASSRAGLDVIARSMGLGGKMKGMDGSLVADEYFVRQNWSQIEEYCAIDVLITYGVLLAVQKFRGVLDTEQFKDCLKQFERFLNQEGKPSTYGELARQSREFFSAGADDAF